MSSEWPTQADVNDLRERIRRLLWLVGEKDKGLRVYNMVARSRALNLTEADAPKEGE